MDYRILGPLDVRDGEAELSLAVPRIRALLALLLVHRNEAVTSDRLIDELWNEAPPRTANKALQNAISQLRRVLPPDVLRTVGHGYRLDVGPDELDADRFERLVEAGLASDDPETTARRLREALCLWRGAPLPELADLAAVRPELARLEDCRAVAFEERVEADLALGRHDRLVAELEAEVARQPLRERLRGQLMLALYRSGRQADALAAFQDTRRTLVGELGIEPGPPLRELHAAILRQDPALDPSHRTFAGRARRRRRAPAVMLLAGGGLLAALAAAGAVLLAGGSEPPAASLRSVPGDSLVAIDARTGQTRAAVPAGGTPTSVTVAGGAAWALNTDDRTLTRADRGSGAVRTLALPGLPTSVAAGGAGLWVAIARPSRFGLRTVPERLLPIDTATGDPGAARALPRGRFGTNDVVANQLAVGRHIVWAIAAGDRLVRLDVRGSHRAVTVPRITATGVVADGDGAWAIAQAPRSPVLLHLSARGDVLARVAIPVGELDGIAGGAGAVWATAPAEGLLWRVSDHGARSTDVGTGALGVAVADGAVWVANATQGTVTRVDPDRDRVMRVLRLGNAPRGIAADGSRLWVTVAAAGGAPALNAGRRVAGAVQSSSCGSVVAGARSPDRVIVSDLPLHRRGIGELPDVITYVLRRHGFRAGRFRLGYQSCDDSTAATGEMDPGKCRADAGLYAQARRVLGIVGPFDSNCTLELLPVISRAPGGPLAAISPTNTLLALTKPVPGGTPGLIRRLYPAGRRNFARLLGSDDAQGGALAAAASERGVRRVAVIDGGGDYGHALAHYARQEARRRHLRVVGPRGLNPAGSAPYAHSHARAAAAARPGAVIFAGEPSTAAVPFVKDLRDRSLRVLLPDAWLNGPVVFTVMGPRRARGLLVTAPGVPLQRMGAAGRRFATAFRATQPGGVITQEGLYTAQATEVLLDAIARSDGTRASVSQALLTTRIRSGFVGPVSFDANGDVRPSPFSLIRLSRHATTLNGVERDGSNIVEILQGR